MKNEQITIGQLTIGSVINFYRSVTADDTNFAILKHYEDRFGNFTECLNLSTLETETFTQHTEIKNFWSIIKIN